MQIPIITITPTIPTAFFSIDVQPITVSTASPNIFPTTGIKLETAAFAVFAVIPSTLLLKLPSTEIEVLAAVNLLKLYFLLLKQV